MANESDGNEIQDQQREQLLKLVTKGFYHELRNFGVDTKEILRVASHLLDHVMGADDPSELGVPYLSGVLDLDRVKDDWKDARTIEVEGVTLRPVEAEAIPRVMAWLEPPVVHQSFIPPFPSTEAGLREFFEDPVNTFFEILFEGKPVGMIGGEYQDDRAGKTAMKKLVGDPAMQGKGIGKRATFAFLYYAFMIEGLNKVYVHSRDINIRNINLNSRFGFELEGVFYEDFVVDGERKDVVRMSLLRDAWMRIFTPPE